MSLRVLLVLEDPTYDQFIAKPVIERLLEEAGKPNAKVVTMTEPHIGGIDQVFDEQRWNIILTKYSAWDLLVVVIDRDGVRTRAAKCVQWQERLLEKGGVTVWSLAIEKLRASWSEVRKEVHPKEQFFLPLVREMGFSGPGGGRKAMMREAMRSYAKLKRSCPEVTTLMADLKTAIGNGK